MVPTPYRLSVLVGWLAAVVFSLTSHAAELPPVEWNVCLSNWHVVGPFPSSEKTTGGTETKIVEREGELRPGDPIEYGGRQIAWQTWDKPVIQFNNALRLRRTTSESAVMYAWTEFQTPTLQTAILCMGYMGSVRVWLNGEEVYSNDDDASTSYLDQATATVNLREGPNTLLLKLAQRSPNAETLVRFRPAQSERPLISLGCERPAGGDSTRVPVLDLDLLDSQGNVLQKLRTSGYRHKNPDGLRFMVYAPEPQVAPSRIRVRYEKEGLKALNQTFDWSAAIEGTIKLPLDADKPARGRVIDAASGKPIVGLQVWSGEKELPRGADQTGRFTLDISPLATNVYVAAGGYEAQKVDVAWPHGSNQTVKLKSGGQVLKGRILSDDGQPLAGARVEPGLYSAYSPHSVTDAEGRFEIVSIPKDQKQLHPVITCDDHVAKDRFSLDLKAGGVTEVEWKLTPGAVITGRVTRKENGGPVAGVTITVGFDRFGSNTKNPATKTDANGRYRLGGVAAGQTMIHAFSDDHAPAMSKLSATRSAPAEINFELESGAPLTGRVVDSVGNPVADVWLVTDTWNGARMFRRETRSEADGRFRLEHMPATPVEVHVIKKDFVSKRDLIVTGGEQVDVTLSPVIEHTIRVRLADSEGPPEDVKVQRGFKWSGRQEISWQDYWQREQEYDKSTGVCKVRMGESYDAEISYRFRMAGYRDAIVTLPKKASQPLSFQVVLETTAGFRGRVVAADTDAPLEGIIVALVSKQDKLFSHLVAFTHPADAIKDFTGVHTVTKADGSFSLPKPEYPATTDIVLTRRGGGFIHLPDSTPWLAADRVDIPYPEHGSIEGTVTVAGRPAAGEIVRIEWRPLDGTNTWDYPFGVGGQVTADAHGHFRFAGLGPGKYQLGRVRSFQSPTGGGLSMYLSGDELILLPGQTLVHDFAQASGHTVRGQTVDPRGVPLGDCVVSANLPPGQKAFSERIDAVRADSEGRFKFHDLPAGQLEFSADHYSVTNGQRCGLGGQDFGGRTTARVDGDTELTIKLESKLGGLAARQDSLAGTIPPDFTAQALDSRKPFTLSDHWGKVVVIDFWATWCGPCMAIMPEVKKLYEQYKNHPEVVFLTVSLDQNELQLRDVLKEQGLEFPVLFSGQGWNDPTARSFGVTGIPNSFVIGRDGRFASDSLHGSQLAEAITAALAVPGEAAYSSDKKPARLTIRTKLDGDDAGIPGLKIKLQALDAAGRPVREDDLAWPGQGEKIIWLYPRLDGGGRIVAFATGAGLAEQRQSLDAVTGDDELTFSFASPRQVTGRVTPRDATESAAGVPGVKVILHGNHGRQRSAISNDDGSFHLAVLPGEYRLSVEGTEKFAPFSRQATTITVPGESDPAPLTIQVARAAVVKGTVIDGQGLPVAGARVQSTANRLTATTNDQGDFNLAGVSSVGPATILASKDRLSGRIVLQDIDGTEQPRIVLGPSAARSGAKGLPLGIEIPTLTAWKMDGQQIEWQPGPDGPCLIVFCAMGHPAGRSLLDQALVWTRDRKVRLVAFSIDWTVEQAARGSATIALETPMLFAGAGGLMISKNWSMTPPAQAFLVSSDGKIVSNPLPGRLP